MAEAFDENPGYIAYPLPGNPDETPAAIRPALLSPTKYQFIRYNYRIISFY
jgi:hypothetical protein